MATKTFSDIITFTRASEATYYDAQGVLRTAAVDEPRLTHDPVTGESLGLLIEEQRTNLLLWSEAFDNAVWTKNGVTVTPNATTAPDGTTTADKIVESSIDETHQIYQQNSYTTGAHSQTLLIKAAGRSVVVLRRINTSVDTVSVTFDLSAETATVGGAIKSVGGGWYACTIYFDVLDTASTSYLIKLRQDSGYLGDGSSGIYIWGAQLEASS